jgi:hypothetical protein
LKERKLDFSRQGIKKWEEFYESIDDCQSGSIGAILARAEAHVLRLAMIYTVLDRSTLIEPKHLAAAKSVWDYCCASAQWAFTNASGNMHADKILWALERAPDGLSREQINNEVFHRNCTKIEIDQALSILKKNKQVDQTYNRGRKGRPSEWWRASNGSESKTGTRNGH